MSLCREGGLRVDVHQLRGNCFALYVRLPGGWNGTRRIVHTHNGPCAGCEPCCDGYNEQGVALVLLVAQWAEQARPVIAPTDFRHRPLDEIVAEIAAGLHKQHKAAKKRGSR